MPTQQAVALDGNRVAASIKHDLARRVGALTGAGTMPGLATVLVGDNAASRAYVDHKHRDCVELGNRSIRVELPSESTTAEIIAAVEELNADSRCTGMIVQLPLSSSVDMNAVLEAIDPDKDADGLHPVNLGRLVLGGVGPLPCTPRGIIELLRFYDLSITGAQFCVIGCGITVGRPLGLMLTGRASTRR